jgi:hypothetical protein
VRGDLCFSQDGKVYQPLSHFGRVRESLSV